MLMKPLVAVLVMAAVVASMGLAQPGTPASPKPPGVPGTAPVKKQMTLTDIFKDESARKAMGLDKLSPDEQQRLADAITTYAAPVRAMELRRSVLRNEAVLYLTRQGWEEDPERKMRDEGWEEMDVVGTTTLKGDRFSLDREVLVVRVLGRKNHYGSGFRDELSRFDRANLRSGQHWGKDVFRNLTLIGTDGREIELKKVEVDNLP